MAQSKTPAGPLRPYPNSLVTRLAEARSLWFYRQVTGRLWPSAECRIMCQATSKLARVRWRFRLQRLEPNDKNQRRKRSPNACFMTWPPTSEMDFVSGISLGQTSTQFWA